MGMICKGLMAGTSYYEKHVTGSALCLYHKLLNEYFGAGSTPNGHRYGAVGRVCWPSMPGVASREAWAEGIKTVGFVRGCRAARTSCPAKVLLIYKKR